MPNILSRTNHKTSLIIRCIPFLLERSLEIEQTHSFARDNQRPYKPMEVWDRSAKLQLPARELLLCLNPWASSLIDPSIVFCSTIKCQIGSTYQGGQILMLKGVIALNMVS